MRIHVKVITATGGGTSRGTRYLVEDKVNPEREGERSRGLFDDREDGMTYRQADRRLTDGRGSPDKKDVLHVIISPEKVSDYEKLGTTEDERLESFMGAARAAFEPLAEECDVERLRWVATIHRDTNHPHLHLLIHKGVINRETGKPGRLRTLPKELLNNSRTFADGTKEEIQGRLAERLSRAIEHRQQIVLERLNPEPSLNDAPGRGTSHTVGPPRQNLPDKRMENDRASLTAGLNAPKQVGRDEPPPTDAPGAGVPLPARPTGDDGMVRYLGYQTTISNELESSSGQLASPGASPALTTPTLAPEERATSQWIRVSSSNPCPVCAKPDNCAVSGDGRVAFCRRVVSPQEGRGGWVHRLAEVAENFRRMGEDLPVLRQNAPAPLERRHQVNQALIGTLRLNDGERNSFRERGLDDRTTAGYEYRSTPTWQESAQSVRQLRAQGLDLQNVPGFFRPDEGKDQWRMSTGGWHRGALIPVRDVDGSIQGFQIRRAEVKTFVNPTTGKEEREPRYVWLSSANRHGDSPGDPPKVRVDGASSGAPVHYRNVGHIGQTGEAIITEGALKADVIAHYLDRGVIGIAGVSSFTPDFGRELRAKIPELRRAFVAFDADVVRKPEVRAALERLRQTLTEAGLEVSIGRWEERDGKGLDDLCQARLGRDFGQSMREDRVERQLTLLREVGWTPYHPERSAPDMTASGRMMLDRPEHVDDGVVSRKSVRLDPGRTEIVRTQTQNSPALPDHSPSPSETPQPTDNEVTARNQAVEGKVDPRQSEARPQDDLQKGWLALINASRAELGEAPLPERMGDILQGDVRPLRSDSQESPAGEIKLWAEAAERHMDATELKIEQIKDAARTFRDNLTASRVADSWVIGVDAPTPQIRATPEKLHERIVLGAALSARLYLEVAEGKLETAREHGHTFRFDLAEEARRHDRTSRVSADVLLQTDSFGGLRNASTTDGLPDGRKVSALDIHRVADARAGRLASERDDASPDERRTLRDQYFKSGITEQNDKLERHDQTLTSLIEKLTDERDVKASRYMTVRPEAELIERKYELPGEMPVPLMERSAIKELQEEAVKTGNVDRFQELELIRERLAGELGQPVRTEKEAARLDAQHATSRGTGAAKLARLHNFEATYQYQRWEINDRRVSLVDVHFELGRAVDAAKIFGRTHVHFDPSARRAAQKEVERLTEVRERILERVAERRAALEEDTLRASVMTAALGAAHAKETLARTEQGRAMPDPLFHKYEIDRLYVAAEEMRDAGLLRDVGRYEKEFLADRGAKDKGMEGQTVRRATGREVLAEVYSAEAERRLELYEKHPGSHVVVITGQDGQQQTYTPVPGDRKFELDHLLRIAWENSEDRATRRAVDGAATEQHRRLVVDVQKTREYGAAAHELAAAGRAELTARGVAETEVWRVELSDKQAADVRVYAERQSDGAARGYYAGLVRGERGASSDREREAIDHGLRDRTQGIDL